MTFELPPLPFAKNALEPHISATTVEYHYEKHHRGYLNKLRDMLDGTAEADKSLEELMKITRDMKVFNLAAQIWNHSFYWQCLSPDGGGNPPEPLAQRLSDRFGSVDNFKQTIAAAANGQFGSGWAWLVKTQEGQLDIVGTGNADNPLMNQLQPLFTIDVWEHAYYLDYQNARDRYVQAVLTSLINWQFISRNLEHRQ